MTNYGPTDELTDRLNKKIEEVAKLEKRVKELDGLISEYVRATQEPTPYDSTTIFKVGEYFPEHILRRRIEDAAKKKEDAAFQAKVAEVVRQVLAENEARAAAQNKPEKGRISIPGCGGGNLKDQTERGGTY